MFAKTPDMKRRRPVLGSAILACAIGITIPAYAVAWPWDKPVYKDYDDCVLRQAKRSDTKQERVNLHSTCRLQYPPRQAWLAALPIRILTLEEKEAIDGKLTGTRIVSYSIHSSFRAVIYNGNENLRSTEITFKLITHPQMATGQDPGVSQSKSQGEDLTDIFGPRPWKLTTIAKVLEELEENGGSSRDYRVSIEVSGQSTETTSTVGVYPDSFKPNWSWMISGAKGYNTEP